MSIYFLITFVIIGYTFLAVIQAPSLDFLTAMTVIFISQLVIGIPTFVLYKIWADKKPT